MLDNNLRLLLGLKERAYVSIFPEYTVSTMVMMKMIHKDAVSSSSVLDIRYKRTGSG